MDGHVTFKVASFKKKGTFLNNLPQNPGVYLYRDKLRQVIYVGKAKNLRSRVGQYFTAKDALGYKTPFLLAQIEFVTLIKTASEFDALILEAKLIRSFQPKYNSIAKDDKSLLYIKITLSEKLPRILYIRKHELSSVSQNELKNKDVYFGPFQSGRDAKEIMRSVRRIVPFCTEKKRTGKPCFYTYLGLCSPCPSRIVKLTEGAAKRALIQKYRRNMLRIRDILNGKSGKVKTDLKKQMMLLSGKENFEEAASVKEQLISLDNLVKRNYDPMTYMHRNHELINIPLDESEALKKTLTPYFPALNELKRIECFDVSNLSGTNATGSLVVISDGLIDKKSYRRFKIQTLKTSDDYTMIKEIVQRRLKHKDWPLPDLIVVDGGKGQLSIVNSVLNVFGMTIPAIGLAKKQEEIVVYTGHTYELIRLKMENPALNMLRRIRDEAHRFAISYHRHLRTKITSELLFNS